MQIALYLSLQVIYMYIIRYRMHNIDIAGKIIFQCGGVLIYRVTLVCGVVNILCLIYGGSYHVIKGVGGMKYKVYLVTDRDA